MGCPGGVVSGAMVSRCPTAPQFMQKKSPLYMLLKEDTVWSMDQLNQYINNKFRKTRGLPKDWVFTTFTVSAPPHLGGGGQGPRLFGAYGDCTGWAGVSPRPRGGRERLY